MSEMNNFTCPHVDSHNILLKMLIYYPLSHKCHLAFESGIFFLLVKE